jgi:hypothetical protein
MVESSLSKAYPVAQNTITVQNAVRRQRSARAATAVIAQQCSHLSTGHHSLLYGKRVVYNDTGCVGRTPCLSLVRVPEQQYLMAVLLNGDTPLQVKAITSVNILQHVL